MTLANRQRFRFRLDKDFERHTYVNPLVALVLGWTIAGEVLTAGFVFGGLVIIAAIALVGRATSREGQATKILEQGRHTSTTEQTSAAKAMN